MPHCTMPQWRFLEISEPLQVIERYFLLRGHRPLASPTSASGEPTKSNTRTKTTARLSG
jgi:hypothetical protein